MESNYWTDRRHRFISRRRFVGGAAAVTAAGLLGAACGGSDDDDEPTATQTQGSGNNSGGSGSPTAAATQQVLQPKRDGILRVAALTGDEPRGGFDPHTGFGGEEHQWDYLVYDQLIGYDREQNLDGSLGLAESWEIVEPTRVVLKIRSGVTYHDGSPFSATEVKWNLDRILDPATKATPRPDIAAIDSVEVSSATEVVLKLKSPSAPLIAALGDRAGMMISPSVFEKLGRDNYMRQPNGTGQFIVKEWTSAATMTLDRNPNYWRKDAQGNQLPYLSTIKARFIPENTVLVATLESGDADLITRTPPIDSDRLNKDSKFQSTRYVGAVTGMFYINHGLPPMDNVWFRRAFASAIDVPTYIKNYLLGVEPLAGGLLGPSYWAYDDTIKGYPYDLKKAKEYLDQSGIPEAEWNVAGGFVPPTEQQQFWEASLKDVGINLQWMDVPPGGTQRHLYVLQGDTPPYIQAAASTWSLRLDPDSTVGQFYTEKSAYNAGGAPTPATEALVSKAREIYERDERKEIYREIQVKGLEELYSCIPTYYGINQSTALASVGNFENFYGGEGKPRFANLWV